MFEVVVEYKKIVLFKLVECFVFWNLKFEVWSKWGWKFLRVEILICLCLVWNFYVFLVIFVEICVFLLSLNLFKFFVRVDESIFLFGLGIESWWEFLCNFYESKLFLVIFIFVWFRFKKFYFRIWVFLVWGNLLLVCEVCVWVFVSV